jgi:serine/threonine protein kinase
MPFDSKDKREIARQTVEDPVPFNLQKFESVSKEAKQLIVALLHKEKRKRITIEECLMHPWMLKQAIPDQYYTKPRSKSIQVEQQL